MLSVNEISKIYAKELGLNDVTHFTDKFAQAIVDRDFWGIGWINNGLNDKAKNIFSMITGYKLPKTQKGSLLVLLEWAKIDYLDYKVTIAENAYKAEFNKVIENYKLDQSLLENLFVVLEKDFLYHKYENIRGGVRLTNSDNLYTEIKDKGTIHLRPLFKAWVEYMKAVEFKGMDNLVNEWKQKQS